MNFVLEKVKGNTWGNDKCIPKQSSLIAVYPNARTNETSAWSNILECKLHIELKRDKSHRMHTRKGPIFLL